MAAAIELQNLTRAFGTKLAVNDVTFSVQAGDCYGLIGPNGAGKTTTFSMMCGFLRPTGGTLRVLGIDPFEPGALKGKVGVLPQDAILPPAWPVGTLLTYYGRLSGLTDPEGQARAALERVKMLDTWKVDAGTLSHGMAKRVAMAQALMGEPPVILLDEPTAGLDPKIAASIRGIIRDLKSKHTVVVSSHNLQELEELCDATAIMDKGKLVSAATMVEITGSESEFRVQLAKGTVPLAEVKALSGCKDAKLESPELLVVRYDGQGVQPGDIITRTVALLASHDVQILGVWRGKKLEDKVLSLT
jgi:ABC-type multidrug transport system ATPase subunit